MQRPTKTRFLKDYGFPPEWETWGLYPNELFEGQLRATADDEKPHPDEHLRYGAFTWWLRRHRELSEENLIQLCRLAALDPDPGMSGAALHDVFFHPSATAKVAKVAAALAQRNEGWADSFRNTDKLAIFNGLLNEGRLFWAEREAAHRVAIDLREGKLGEPELRDLYATGAPLVLRGLAEHPKLPPDLLLQLSQSHAGPFSRAVRSIATRRVSGKKVAPTDYAEKYSVDPWLWPRSR